MKTYNGFLKLKDTKINHLKRENEDLKMLVSNMLDYIGCDLGLLHAEQVYGERYAKILEDN